MTGSILTISGSAEARALGEAITSLRSAPEGPARLASELELLTERCRAFPEETRRLWDWFEAQQPVGSTETLREPFEGHLHLLDERIRVVNEAQALAAEAGRGNGSQPHTQALAAALADLAAQRERIAGIWDRLNAPFAPSTEPEYRMPKMTKEEVLAAIERGEFETIESILERLRAGGPLVKDGDE